MQYAYFSSKQAKANPALLTRKCGHRYLWGALKTIIRFIQLYYSLCSHGCKKRKVIFANVFLYASLSKY